MTIPFLCIRSVSHRLYFYNPYYLIFNEAIDVFINKTKYEILERGGREVYIISKFFPFILLRISKKISYICLYVKAHV